ncbi:MAG: hypothetical protein PHP97_00345 [Candidatus Shapirobacteria bacterium]|nr:hypothetical protein [Candidatus Shapirobacteria bacterium]MDD3002652.1 hypothetical protein [Candidatus Shapirobacteria bacterium]MDD4382833.1 hypothetical protein [Candidatus Shapirobacteria bacterium]
MTDNDRNARTLVACFVLAVLSLTVLRFVEMGQNVAVVSRSQVLGETVQKEDVILPNAEVEREVLHANYIGR